MSVKVSTQFPSFETYENTPVKVMGLLSGLCSEDADGFMKAANEIADESLAVMFESHASERDAFATRLANEIVVLGGNEDDIAIKTVLIGDLNELWLDVLGSISNGDPHVILSQCEMAENYLAKRYQDALDLHRNLPMNIQKILRKQLQSIRDTHVQLQKKRETIADGQQV